MFLDTKYLKELCTVKTVPTNTQLDQIIEKAKSYTQLSMEEINLLLNIDNQAQLDKILQVAGEIKYDLYKNRLVLFAPLYISDFCKNNCSYCGYKRDNDMTRRKLSFEEIKAEVKVLEEMGHKRLALEVGEDAFNTPFSYILEAIDAIYEAGDIRRININIAATTVENYKLLSEKEIGTYILFQETYDQDKYAEYHKNSLKGDYMRQLMAHHRANEGGIHDVGGGVLYGLGDYKYDTLALISHNNELDQQFGAGFHTISVPRLKPAEGMDTSMYELVSDFDFKKIVATLRFACPYAGIILSTREPIGMRTLLMKCGVSQISAGSQTGVGSYAKEESNLQFSVDDERSPLEVIKELLSNGLMPSYCTSCYRSGRVGQDFMDIVKIGKIGEICAPNALITFVEFVKDFGDQELTELAIPVINQELEEIPNEKLKTRVRGILKEIEKGARDLYV